MFFSRRPSQDANLNVLVVSATHLKNKRMLGAQDVSLTIGGMMHDTRASRTLEDCGVNATFNQSFAFPWRGNTQPSCVLTVTLWKEDGVREQLGRAELQTLKYRRTFAAVDVEVPITDQGNAAGTLRLRIHTHDPAHEAELARQAQHAAEVARLTHEAAEREARLAQEHDAAERARLEQEARDAADRLARLQLEHEATERARLEAEAAERARLEAEAAAVAAAAAAAEAERIRLEQEAAAAAAAAEAERIRLEQEAAAAAAAAAAAEAAAAAAAAAAEAERACQEQYACVHPEHGFIRAHNGTPLAFHIVEIPWVGKQVNFGLLSNLPPGADARVRFNWLDEFRFQVQCANDGGQWVSGDLGVTDQGGAAVFQIIDAVYEGGARTRCFLQMPNGCFANTDESWRGLTLHNNSTNKGAWETWTLDSQ